tara:strand:- start:82 stop:1038 length:957 start_codon:yes stop_codon:yes gene_type:complete
MKDLILISAYCPDKTRLELLSNLVDSIDNTNFDILISSHSPIPDSIQKKVNFYFYDKENPLVKDIKSSPKYWHRLPEKGIIYHSKLENSNTFLAVFRLVRYGLALAKTLGYKITHILEYDSLILDDTLLYKNSKLTQNKDCLIYNTIIDDFSAYGPYKCINLDLITSEYTTYDRVKILNHFKTTSNSLVEGYAFNLLSSNQNYIIHDQNILFKYIETGLFISDVKTNYTIIPYVYDDKLNYYLYNSSKLNPINIKLNINHGIPTEIILNPMEWKILSFNNYDKINYIECLVNDITFFNLDLTKDDNKQQFKLHHYKED